MDQLTQGFVNPNQSRIDEWKARKQYLLDAQARGESVPGYSIPVQISKLDQNINYYESGAGYQDAYRDYQLQQAEKLAPQLGVTAAQLVANPGLISDQEALAKYTGGTYGGVSYAPGTDAWQALQTPMTQTTMASPTGATVSQTPTLNIRSTLKRGSTGPEVEELQRQLNQLTGANLVVDGQFGPATEAAVRAYQSQSGIRVDGIVGPQTLGAMQGQEVQGNPVLSIIDQSITSDEAKQQWLDSLTPELRAIYEPVIMNIAEKVSQGERVNPNLEITPQMTARFLAEATKELDPYYKELIRQNQQDLNISFRQLEEDYRKAVQQEEPAFQRSLESQDIAEAESGLAFSSGRKKREQELIGEQQRRLDELLTGTQREAQRLGIAGERLLGSSAFNQIGIPSLTSYAAQRSTTAKPNMATGSFATTGTRTLSGLQGDLFGEIPAQRKTDISTRASDLEDVERQQRILDYSSKFGLGSSSLG